MKKIIKKIRIRKGIQKTYLGNFETLEVIDDPIIFAQTINEIIDKINDL